MKSIDAVRGAGRIWARLAVAAIVVILLIALGSNQRGGDSIDGEANGAPSVSSSSADATASADRSSDQRSDGGDLPAVARSELPPEAQATLRLVAAGGPYPYRQDGRVFSNRERLLPVRERGFYREYTVVTPGSDDRGARRVVTGRDGRHYYTDDHYRTFSRIQQ